MSGSKIEFHRVTLEDREWMNELFIKENSKSADYNFTNIFIWDSIYHQSVARYKDYVLTKLEMEDDIYYAFPVGKGPIWEVIDRMKEDAAYHGHPLKVGGVTKEHLAKLDAAGIPYQNLHESEEFADYVYDIESLVTLSGRKLHAKRNHISHFQKNYDWRFEVITPDNIGRCKEIYDEWMKHLDGEERDESVYEEREALHMAMTHFEALHLSGGMILADEKIVAFTVGDRLGADSFLIHFEKADRAMQGGFAMINQQFAQYISEQFPDVKYINREEDMGLESLRKAKMSYNPCMKVKKYELIL
jgi:hypothetical protein